MNADVQLRECTGWESTGNIYEYRCLIGTGKG